MYDHCIDCGIQNWYSVPTFKNANDLQILKKQGNILYKWPIRIMSIKEPNCSIILHGVLKKNESGNKLLDFEKM